MSGQLRRKEKRMPFQTYSREAYWNSYRLLESQLLRLSHSIRFDDHQIHVYSSELADIINSACIKIESLAKDIYEEHIWPFQDDNGMVPKCFTDGYQKKSADKFNSEKWTRVQWKYDYHCLVEIDRAFSLSKKRIELRLEKFNFQKYGRTILPFGNVSLNHCEGGYWQYSERDIWHPDTHMLKAVNWCKSYQAIKHNYIQSISKHGTIENAIMVLAAFYLLAVYNSCLPQRQFRMEDKVDNYSLNFGSELFSCEMCNCTIPPCIIDSDYEKWEKENRSREKDPARQIIFSEQELINDIEGLPFLVTLNAETYCKVNRMVEEYCAPRGLEYFDIAPYERENGLATTDAGTLLYLNLKKYIMAPYHRQNICISFNIGKKDIYKGLLANSFDYEKSKYKNRTKAVLAELKVGDVVDAKFEIEVEVSGGKVVEIDEFTISIAVQVDGVSKTLVNPKVNIIYIRKRK